MARRLRGERAGRLVGRNDGRRACQSIAVGTLEPGPSVRYALPTKVGSGGGEALENYREGFGRLRQEVSSDPKAYGRNAQIVSLLGREWMRLFFCAELFYVVVGRTVEEDSERQ